MSIDMDTAPLPVSQRSLPLMLRRSIPQDRRWSTRYGGKPLTAPHTVCGWPGELFEAARNP
jgi:hypothetical protein